MSTFARLVLVLAVLTTAVACDPDSLVAELTPLIGSSWEAQQD